jgi:MoaA/NifB/PqqE/SkfB family radical SAM enzyme
MDFWEKNLTKINMTNLSVHPRYANFKHVLEVVKLGIEKKSIVKVAVIMDLEYWDRAIEAVNFFKENNVPTMEFKGLVFKLDGKDEKNGTKAHDYYNSYTEEQMNFIKNNTYHKNIKNLKEINPNYQTRNAYAVYEDDTREKFLGQEIVTKNLNKFKGYECDAGKSHLSIKWDGKVAGSNCGIRTLTFGSLLKNPNLKIKLLKHPTICDREKCGCIADMRISKRAK